MIFVPNLRVIRTLIEIIFYAKCLKLFWTFEDWLKYYRESQKQRGVGILSVKTESLFELFRVIEYVRISFNCFTRFTSFTRFCVSTYSRMEILGIAQEFGNRKMIRYISLIWVWLLIFAIQKIKLCTSIWYLVQPCFF